MSTANAWQSKLKSNTSSLNLFNAPKQLQQALVEQAMQLQEYTFGD